MLLCRVMCVLCFGFIALLVDPARRTCSCAFVIRTVSTDTLDARALYPLLLVFTAFIKLQA